MQSVRSPPLFSGKERPWRDAPSYGPTTGRVNTSICFGVSDLRIRPAAEADIPVILSFIRDLAEYEKLPQEVVATEERLRRALFGSPSRAEVVLACQGQDPVGFALFFHSFSTFLGLPG